MTEGPLTTSNLTSTIAVTSEETPTTTISTENTTVIYKSEASSIAPTTTSSSETFLDNFVSFIGLKIEFLIDYLLFIIVRMPVFSGRNVLTLHRK